MSHSLSVAPTTFIAITDIVTVNNSDGIFIHRPIEPKLETLLINATLSVLSLGIAFEAQTAEIQSWETVYTYVAPTRLFVAYGLSLAFALVAVLFGYWSLYRNGKAFNRGFLQVLLATRNQELDELAAADVGL